MLAYASQLLQLARLLGQRFFHQFGLHCATHQIRVILISCVVITSLFYPALAIYSSSQPKSLSVIDAFVSLDPTSTLHAQKDLVNIWSNYDALRELGDSISRASCGVGRTLRVERILLQSPLVDDDDSALNHRILLSTLDLEQRLEPLLSSGTSPCLKRPDGKCLVISPLAFWDYDKDALLSDVNILDTLSNTRNTTVGGVPVSPHMVLAGRGSYEHPVGSSKFDFATFLALTYFFPDVNCIDKTGHMQWEEAVIAVASQIAKIDVGIQPPTIIGLEYNLNHSQVKEWSALSTFLFIAYSGFFVYVAWSVRRMDALHDRIGVTFTALVEIAVSTITSLSVCALVGFQVTLVPWELLPIVIAFVGAENMFNLVDAVGRTSVTLSVKERIAQGLSYAGTSNTLKVISYNGILGIIAVAGSGAVRQFCIFAIVVLVAHWFLAHTFFITVLSIDIQRLELEELLRRDTTLAPSLVRKNSGSPKQTRSGAVGLIYAGKRLLKGRAATNMSLLLLLAITATLYYTTYTTSVIKPHIRPPTPLGAVSRNQVRPMELPTQNSSAAWQVWKAFNPDKPLVTKMLHMRIEQPFVITLIPDSSTAKRHIHRSLLTYRSVLWLFKFMVLPIAATTGLLWLLCLYLLKNAELLEAQKHHPDSSALEEGNDHAIPIKGQVSFSTLPRTFASDVELIASSRDGQIVVSIGLHNEVTVWNRATQIHMSIHPTNLLIRSSGTSCANSSLTSLAIDENGKHFAIGTGAGIIGLWKIEQTSVYALPFLSPENSSSAVIDLVFGGPVVEDNSSLGSNLGALAESKHNTILLATLENGIAIKWTLNDFATASYLTPSRDIPIVRSFLVRVMPDGEILVAYAFNDGSLELAETGDGPPIIPLNYHIRPGTQDDVVWKVQACRSELGGLTRLIVATATESGVVSVWDGSTKEHVSVLEDAGGPIGNLRISPVKCHICHYCGQLPLECVSIAYSIDYIVRFINVYLKDQSRRCSCTTRAQLTGIPSADHLGRRSRSNSAASSQKGSPLIPKARLATTFESSSSSFPVSGHGVHSRRASDKDAGRRSSHELLAIPVSGDDRDGPSSLDGQNYTPQITATFWRNAFAAPVMEVTCERGRWDTLNGQYVGIRRKPRLQGKSHGSPKVIRNAPSSDEGLTDTTLERWELWIFDPASSRLRSSTLRSLTLKPPENETVPPPGTKSLTDSIPRLPFTRVSSLSITYSHALAGFGNTTGIFQFSDI